MSRFDADAVITLAAGLPPEERAFQVALRLHEDFGISLARFREVARTSRVRRSFCFLVEDHLERLVACHPVDHADPSLAVRPVRPDLPSPVRAVVA